VIVSNLSTAEGAEAAKRILAMPGRPDAVFSANDSCAIGCMLELKKYGIKIPSDIAFVGFNNDPMCCVTEPNLTTVTYNGYEMGRLAARVLIGNLINKIDTITTHSIVLRSELIIREFSLKNKIEGNGM
jgi:LacI family transcriptional regulator